MMTDRPPRPSFADMVRAGEHLHRPRTKTAQFPAVTTPTADATPVPEAPRVGQRGRPALAIQTEADPTAKDPLDETRTRRRTKPFSTQRLFVEMAAANADEGAPASGIAADALPASPTSQRIVVPPPSTRPAQAAVVDGDPRRIRIDAASEDGWVLRGEDDEE